MTQARRLDAQWWAAKKHNYIFDPEWFKAFPFPLPIDPMHYPFRFPKDMDKSGKMGVVFWHEEDGKTIIPVGITYREGDTFTFCYHPDYVADPSTKPLSIRLPKRDEPYVYKSKKSLLPFFDNLVSEGWLGMAQRHAEHSLANKHNGATTIEDFEESDVADDRYHRMLMFGRGFHGAVAIVDAALPDQVLEWEDKLIAEALASRASLTGAQAKMVGVMTALTQGRGVIRPAKRHEVSTHIVKIAESRFPNIIRNEYLNIIATKKLLPDDQTVNSMEGRMEDGADSLGIVRFDRTPHGGRIHFEEALQVANAPYDNRYDFGYEDLARFTHELTGQGGVEKLFKRLLAQFMLGNTDSHMKNFGFWQKDGKWELVPNYDLVSTVNYKRSDLALTLNGNPVLFKAIDAKRIFQLGKTFGISVDRVKEIGDELQARIPSAVEAIMKMESPTFHMAEREKVEFCDKLKGRAGEQYKTFNRYHAIAKEREQSSTRHKGGN